MARPRAFDRDAALERAIQVFWVNGFAATSTEHLVEVMGIGRQSLYNTFGDKRQLYLEALETYQRNSTARHLKRLEGPASALEGIQAMLLGLIAEDAKVRAMGCMGVCAVNEFGTTDPAVNNLREKASRPLRKRLVERLRESQLAGEIDPVMYAEEAADFVLMTMTGLQSAARAGASSKALQTMVRFTTDRLKPL